MSDEQIETPHELVLENRYSAAAEQVWAAWTTPERFAAWWVAPGWTTSDVVLDARVGGRFSAIQSADDGSMTVPFGGFYRAVEPHRLLEFTLSDADTADQPARTVLTVELQEGTGDDGRVATDQTFRQTGVITDEHFEALKAGTTMFLAQLGEHLAAE